MPKIMLAQSAKAHRRTLSMNQFLISARLFNQSERALHRDYVIKVYTFSCQTRVKLRAILSPVPKCPAGQYLL